MNKIWKQIVLGLSLALLMAWLFFSNSVEAYHPGTQAQPTTIYMLYWDRPGEKLLHRAFLSGMACVYSASKYDQEKPSYSEDEYDCMVYTADKGTPTVEGFPLEAYALFRRQPPQFTLEYIVFTESEFCDKAVAENEIEGARLECQTYYLQ